MPKSFFIPRFAAVAATVLAGVLPAAAADADTPWSISVRSDYHADAVALRHVDDDRAALDNLDPRRGRNLAYVEDEVRASRRLGGTTWSLVARNSATLVTNHEGLDVVRQVAGRVTPEADRRWDVDAALKAFSGAGLEVAWATSSAATWQAGVAVQVLSLRRWRERDIHGAVQFDAARGGYDFDLVSTERSERLVFPFQQPYDSRGIGLLLAGALTWRPAPEVSFTLAVRDLGWLRWRGIPQEDARLSSFTRDVDEEGFVVFKPLVEGRNRQVDHRVRLAPKAAVRARWDTGGLGAVEVGADSIPEFGLLPSVAWQRRFGALDAGLGWRFHERRATLTLGWRGWRLRMGTDRLGGAARSRDIGLSVAF
jgi:hypothetical protein